MTTKTTNPALQAGNDIIVVETDHGSNIARLQVTAGRYGTLATASSDRAERFARLDLPLGCADGTVAAAGLAAMELAHSRCSWLRWDREDGAAWPRAETACRGHVDEATHLLVRKQQPACRFDFSQNLLSDQCETARESRSSEEVPA